MKRYSPTDSHHQHSGARSSVIVTSCERTAPCLPAGRRARSEAKNLALPVLSRSELYYNLISNFLPFIKYCLVGASGTLIDLGSLYIFVEYGHLPAVPASVLSFLLAVINNFTFNKIWTFKNKSSNYRKLFVKFLIVSTIGLVLTVCFMQIFVNLLKIWYLLAKALTSAIVLTWNFLGNKFWTFKIVEKIFHTPHHPSCELSIIIPAYNEECRIKSTLLLIGDFVKTNKIDSEIIVVNDGSTDGTSAVIASLQKNLPNLILENLKCNFGKGYAVKRGVALSKGKYILFTDADGSTPIEEVLKLWESIKNHSAEVAIGSRYLHDSKVLIAQPKYRVLLGRMGNFLISTFLLDGIKDTQCGFKLFTNKAAKEIFSLQKVKRFGFDMEILTIANLLNYKIIEVPVSWLNSPESRMRPVKDVLITLKDLFFIKINLWSGRYSSEDQL